MSTDAKKALHWKQLCGKPYLTADDLNGKEVTLTIKEARMETMFNPKAKKEIEGGVIQFNETELKMVLNKTNAKAIKNQYGNNSVDWAGKQITLRPEVTKLMGEMVDCIRVVDNSKPTFKKAGDI